MLVDGFTTQVDVPELEGLVHTTRTGRRDGVRQYVYIPGVSPGLDYRCHNNTVANLRRGVAERVLYLRKGDDFVKCHVPDRQLVDDRLSGFLGKLRHKLPPTTPIDLEDFPKYYRGRKHLVYLRAVESLLYNPLTRDDALLRVFVKYEKINFSKRFDPAPRIISPRSPRYNASLGRYLRPAEPLVYKGIARVWGETTVAKGLNALETGALIADKWNRYMRPCAIGLDASRFDQHVSRPMLEWEHRVYLHMFGNDAELARMLSWQLDNRGVGYCPDGSVKYTTSGVRMSGDMNTSMGNSLLMSAMVWAFAESRHVKCSLINNGDDCVVFMEQRDEVRFLSGLHEWFEEMGFDMKQEPTVYELEKVEFCQNHPINVGGDEYLMVRNVEACLGKDAITMIQANKRGMVGAWCSAVGQGGTAMYSGVPVLGSFYDAYTRQGRVNLRWAATYQERGLDHLAKGMNRRGMPVLDVTRLSFYVAFGITPDEQVALEAHFQRWSISDDVPQAPREISPGLTHEFSEIVLQACEHRLDC